MNNKWEIFFGKASLGLCLFSFFGAIAMALLTNYDFISEGSNLTKIVRFFIIFCFVLFYICAAIYWFLSIRELFRYRGSIETSEMVLLLLVLAILLWIGSYFVFFYLKRVENR